jgi:putative DNA methylase
MAAPYRKKLIEVALPLDAINAASALEKEPFTRNHPRSLHIWWARRPLVACRAVLFASLVDDPGEYLPEEEAKKERERLFRLIEQLVTWENSNNEAVLSAARAEIMKSTNGNPPPVLDPFCGGGSIPLEAQRLGLEAHASDLNPVAVLITKALIELPAKFRDHPPVNSDAKKGMKADAAPKSALADDVRWYGKWMRDEAFKRLAHLYPRGPNGETVIAWLWARTVKCPNPACGARMPLVRSFALSTKKGKEAWVEPVVDRASAPPKIRFWVRTGHGTPTEPPKVGRGAQFRCLACDNVAPEQHIKDEAMDGRMCSQMLAFVAEGKGGRIYMPPSAEQERIPNSVERIQDAPTQALADDPRNIWCVGYGLDTFDKLFTPRQLVALTTFSGLVGEARARVLADSGGDAAYANAVATYLGIVVSRWTDLSNTICSWNATNQNVRALFARHAIPMAWDFAELSPFGTLAPIDSIFASSATSLESVPALRVGQADQHDAAALNYSLQHALISTDPPYYDNVGYADLSDFFYVWLRRSLGKIYPDLFSTLLVPKAQELTASPYRFDGSREKAMRFFEDGLGHAFVRMRAVQRSDYPMTVYYAFKQAESAGYGNGLSESTMVSASTGWETMLEGLLKAGFAITGTWPMRTERGSRSISIGTNALASSIVLVCRPRPTNASMATRKEFVRALQNELSKALDLLIKGTAPVSAIAPVDLAQAAIGPGMAVFSRYSQVLEASGEPMRVRSALELINQEIERYFSAQEGEQDGPTRFCLTWYKTYGSSVGQYGTAETLSKTYTVDVSRLARQGLLDSGGGKVRVLPASAYPEGAWDPTTAHPLTTWEATHRLVAAMLQGGGVKAAAAIAGRLGGKAEEARELAYLLYQEASKRGWTAEAAGYNDLVVSWPDIQKLVSGAQGTTQERLL